MWVVFHLVYQFRFRCNTYSEKSKLCSHVLIPFIHSIIYNSEHCCIYCITVYNCDYSECRLALMPELTCTLHVSCPFSCSCTQSDVCLFGFLIQFTVAEIWCCWLHCGCSSLYYHNSSFPDPCNAHSHTNYLLAIISKESHKVGCSTPIPS